MRPFTLASIVVASVVVGLVTPASSSAAAAPAAAGKRTAKRAAATPPSGPSRVLPAPLPKPEPLPQLPPVARDVTAITALTSASMPEASNAAWRSVVARESIDGGTSEALAPLPATPPAREVVTVTNDAGTEVKPKGFVVDFGMGALLPATSFVSGVRALGPGISFDARLGYYVTPHVGILVGFRGSYGHHAPGCSGDSCDGYSLQVPVMVQFAGTDRARGVYFEVGIGLGTTYAASTNGAAYKLSSPAELKLGLGYRVAGAGGARRTTTLDLNLGADIGSIKSAEIDTDTGSYSGSIDGTTHVVVALSVISHFSL